MEPLLRPLAQGPRDQALDRTRDLGTGRGEAGRGVADPLGQEGDARLGGERRAPSDHLEEHTAQGVDVAPAIERGVVRLLRAHVGRRADEGAGNRQGVVGGGAHGPRHAEVGDDGVTVLEEDVRGFDVAVNDLLPVGVVEGIGHFTCEPEGLRQREPLLAVEHGAQRAARHVGTDVIEEAVGLARIVERQQVGMLQPRRQPDLSQEALCAERLAELRLEHLQRDDSVVPLVAGLVHHRHPAASDLPLDGVASVEGGAEAFELVGHPATISSLHPSRDKPGRCR